MDNIQCSGTRVAAGRARAAAASRARGVRGRTRGAARACVHSMHACARVRPLSVCTRRACVRVRTRACASSHACVRPHIRSHILCAAPDGLSPRRSSSCIRGCEARTCRSRRCPRRTGRCWRRCSIGHRVPGSVGFGFSRVCPWVIFWRILAGFWQTFANFSEF